MRPIKGGSGVPVACGGLQPDSHHQPAEESGGDGMKTVIMRGAKDQIGQLQTLVSGPPMNEGRLGGAANQIDAASMTVTNGSKIRLLRAFSAAS
jgi:hypothetical protein